MTYRKPDGLLKDIQQSRLTAKSRWLKRPEARQAEARTRDEAVARKVTPIRRQEARS